MMSGGRVAGWGQDGGPPSFLPSLVICSNPGVDGTRGPLARSTLGFSAPKCCVAVGPLQAHRLLSQSQSQSRTRELLHTSE